MTNLIISTIAQGLLWALLALGVFITFRILDVADLTVEGSFPMGAAISAVLITMGVNPWITVIVAGIGGMIAGAVTGWIHTKLKIPALLAGILTMIALYSVNLHIMGKANISLLRMDTVYSAIHSMGISNAVALTIIGVVVTVVVGLFLFWFFGTELGTSIRATGVNPQMIRAQGVNTDSMIVLGLLLSNGFVAVSGALIAQSQGFADIGMGVGTIVIGLASVIIGEVLFASSSVVRKLFGNSSFVLSLVAVVFGSIIYRIVIATVLYLGMPPNDLKLFTAILVALALSLPTWQGKFRRS
ncbi:MULTISPECIES: ABC transporter permease [unclassified Veillonella]|jgi:putative ABC transport system permease protein|uniref:ABC transporter permease n=1 Tax=unclassified Veillonella TaxID=2630086 RepID=UPI00021A2C99|nr:MULTISPECIES: ABC transporter permease [unclassified Veillonella]EGS35522.1 branched-chain amino acid ABC transporter, permease protein [Veillonella sp. oral taxon 780 str. F0422]KXB88294.1 branched-chain amino acid ABC transporter, permease protein [Veillonella sp. DNF00869]